MKIKLDEPKILEFKIETSSGVSEEDIQGFLRFNIGGIEYGFPAKIEEGCFKVEVPPFQNVINSKLTESISQNKELIVKGRLDVIANKNTYVSPWSGEIDIEIPVSMDVSEGKKGNQLKEEVTVENPDDNDLLKAFNEVFGETKEEEEKESKLKQMFDIKVEEKEEETEEEEIDEKEKMAGWIAMYGGKKLEIKKSEADGLYGAKQLAIKKLKVPKSKEGLLAIKPAYESKEEEPDGGDSPKKSRFAQSLEEAYVKEK